MYLISEKRAAEDVFDSMDMNLRKLWEIVKERGAWHAAVMGPPRVGYNLASEQQHLRDVMEKKCTF